MKDNAELYILIIAYMTLTSIQGYRDERKQNICHQLFHIVVDGIGWNV